MHKPVPGKLSTVINLPAVNLPAVNLPAVNLPAVKLSVVILPAAILLSALLTTACSNQNWYIGAQSAHKAHCMKQPVSEYEDCMQQTSESYNEYELKRQDVLDADKN
jgi:hypothetical protein